MFVLLAIGFLLVHISLADRKVVFPDKEDGTNPTGEGKFGETILGKFLNDLMIAFIVDPAVPAPVQTATTAARTTPTTTEDRPAGLPTFPPLPSSAFPFPTFESASAASPPPTSFPTGVVTPVDGFPSAVASEQVPAVVGFDRCECTSLLLCTNRTMRSGATTRIVTKPPTGINCPTGEVYCCADASKASCGYPNVIPGTTPSDGQGDLGEFPWSAIIFTDDNEYVGGGALVDSSHVITVAHRVARYGNGAGLKVRLGDWDLFRNDEPVKYLEVKISKIVNHPKFEANTLKNDISVIRLATPVSTLTRPYPQINTICLPESTAIFSGSRCKVAGWGKDGFRGVYQNILKKVDVPVLSSIDCQTKLRNTRLGTDFVLDTNSFLCAGGEASRDACTGDGGNALACMVNGRYYAAGLTAGGIECGNEGVPGLYVNIVNYLTWINSQITGNIGVGIDPRRRPV